jgi:hypothetical protein
MSCRCGGLLALPGASDRERDGSVTPLSCLEKGYHFFLALMIGSIYDSESAPAAAWSSWKVTCGCELSAMTKDLH